MAAAKVVGALKASGWPLRNFIAFLAMRYRVAKATFIAYRPHGSLVISVDIPGE